MEIHTQTQNQKQMQTTTQTNDRDVTPNGISGTAVFVGRASFRMIAPGSVVAAERENEMLTPTPTPVPAQPDVRWFAPSERVVLLPPESLARNIPGDAELEQQLGASLSNEGNPERRSMPWWAIAAALVVGATATLSAQAVMRRPVTVAPQGGGGNANDVDWKSKEKSTEKSTEKKAWQGGGAAVAPPSTIVEPSEATPAILPAEILQPAAVQASTVPPSGAGEGTAAEGGARLVVTSARSRPARTVPRVAARPPAESPAVKATVASPARWVDPFAGDTIPGFVPRAHGSTTTSVATASRSATPAKRTNISGAASSNNATWIDPFVN